jgi:hypothetical protein
VINNPESNGIDITHAVLKVYRQKNIDIDFKNIQRRVYDALNVLSALNIITKDRNKISYRG